MSRKRKIANGTRNVSSPETSPVISPVVENVNVEHPAIANGNVVVTRPVKRVNNEIDDATRVARIDELKGMLRASRGDRAMGKKLRRLLRSLGHFGGLRDERSPL